LVSVRACLLSAGSFILSGQVNQVDIVARQNLPAIDPSGEWSIFQFQNSAGTNSAANTAAHATRAYYIFSLLSVMAYIDPHFAIGGTISAGNTLSPVGGYPEPGKKSLLESQDSGHGTAETAPHPAPENGVKANPDNT
jgi:hypothetical protein